MCVLCAPSASPVVAGIVISATESIVISATESIDSPGPFAPAMTRSIRHRGRSLLPPAGITSCNCRSPPSRRSTCALRRRLVEKATGCVRRNHPSGFQQLPADLHIYGATGSNKTVISVKPWSSRLILLRPKLHGLVPILDGTSTMELSGYPLIIASQRSFMRDLPDVWRECRGWVTLSVDPSTLQGNA